MDPSKGKGKAILAIALPKGDDTDKTVDTESMFTEASKELLKALGKSMVSDDEALKFGEALKDFMDVCKMQEEDSGSEEESDKEME